MRVPMPRPRPEAARLFLLGFLTLFLELVLIRNLAGNIWNLGFFPNLVLLGVFMGMGVGFTFHHYVREEASAALFHAAAVLLAVLAALVTFLRPTVPGFGTWQADFGGDLYFTSGPAQRAAPNALLFLVWFLLIVAVFALVSQRTAKLFRGFPPLTAYTLDIAGSCCGIAAFAVMSWLRMPAWVWFLVVLVVFPLAAGASAGGLRWLSPAALAACVALAVYQDTRLLADPGFRGALAVTWSPYQKVEYVDTEAIPRRIFVNGVSHQHMDTPENLRGLSSGIPYTAPYQVRAAAPGLAPYRSVLILGAGAGNDVAAALLSGATHVDAVEIDPVIAELGRRHHPAHPYQDPRVTVTVDDGRAFMTRSRRQYDLIVFALTDSLVKVSPMAQLRLENYLFTQESIERAYSLLADDGDLLFYNFYRRPWLRQKIEAMALAVSGRPARPIYQHEDFVMMTAGRPAGAPRTPAVARAAGDAPRDDWPFPYLQTRGIPRVYLGAMAGLTVMMLGLMVALHRSARRFPHLGADRCGLSTKVAFVFMGIAFLLLETKSVIQFSLLFGTTWVNNSLVFLGVLLLVLAANWAALRLRLKASHLWAVYGILLLSCLASLVYPLRHLLAVESGAWRFVLASLLTFSPIFFANLIFSVALRDQEVPEHLFGWNLIGATLGGVLEYTSLAVGYNNLALVVAACYTIAVVALAAGRRVPQPRLAVAPG
jgi:spermidine synthase